MDIYENVVIGNFLYGLGVVMGTRGDAKELPLSVNLLQQTPLDREVGDVLVRGATVMRILEFKRLANDDQKEGGKLLHLERGLLAKEVQDLIPISREVHWYVESSNPNTQLHLRIVPYLDFKNTTLKGPDFEQFIATMVKDAVHATSDKSTIYSRYLQLVACCQGSIKGGSGGIVVTASAEGAVNYAVVEDLRELGLKLTKFHELYKERQLERLQQYEKQWERTFSGPTIGGYSR